MNESLKKYFENFYKNLPSGSTLISVSFSRDSKKDNYYSIDENYKVVRADIKDPDNGYYYSGYTFGDSDIDKSLKNNSLYAIPIPEIDYTKKLNKAIFLDRDGILMKDEGYVGSIDRVFIVSEFIEFVKVAKEKGYLAVVTTNQSGVAYGYYTEEDVQKVHNYLSSEYKKHGAIIDDFLYCPYHTKGENTKYVKETVIRKPMPGMHLTLAQKYNIDITKSFMVGDRDFDIINLPYLKTYLIETPAYKIINRDKIVSIKSLTEKLV